MTPLQIIHKHNIYTIEQFDREIHEVDHLDLRLVLTLEHYLHSGHMLVRTAAVLEAARDALKADKARLWGLVPQMVGVVEAVATLQDEEDAQVGEARELLAVIHMENR